LRKNKNEWYAGYFYYLKITSLRSKVGLEVYSQFPIFTVIVPVMP
jgi:hypothetical protein